MSYRVPASSPGPRPRQAREAATNAVGASLVGALTASPILSILSIHVNTYLCQEGAVGEVKRP